MKPWGQILREAGIKESPGRPEALQRAAKRTETRRHRPKPKGKRK